MERDRRLAKPARPGLKVAMPGTRAHLPPEGAVVVLSSYWIRREADGDVVLTALEPEPRAAKSARKE